MELSPTWIRDFVDLKVDNATLAHDLTSIGVAVGSLEGELAVLARPAIERGAGQRPGLQERIHHVRGQPRDRVVVVARR